MNPRRATQAAALLTFAAVALAGCAVSGQASGKPAVTYPSFMPSATVGKVKITQGQVDARTRILALLDPAVAVKQAVTKTTAAQAVSQLVEESLILQGNPQKLPTAAASQMNINLGQYLVQQYGSTSGASAREKALKLTAADLKTFANEQATLSVAATKYEPKVTQAQIQAFYTANQATFKLTAPEVNARHILVKTDAEAKSILKQLEGGASFAALAKKDSIDTGSAAQGGNLGWSTASQMVAPFSKAAFATAVGHYVIAHSQYGWHVIQVLGKEAAGTVPLLSQVQTQAATDAQQAADQSNIAAAVAQLKTRFPVKVHTPKG